MSKLLVVEDDAKIAAAVKRGLEFEGFTVDVARDGDDGWWMATESEYDLMILDVMLPRRDGLSLCADLRVAGNWTPILMLTAKDGDAAQTQGLAAGADDYVTKPFSFPILIARTRAILRRCQHTNVAPLEVGSIRIDPASHRAWAHGAEVQLTHREFAVLEFLARHAGQTVSKDAILRGVWEFDFEGSANIAQVYVTRLRRKLDLPHGTEHIQTIHGVGYRLIDDGR